MFVELEWGMSTKKNFEFKFLFSTNSFLKWANFGSDFKNQLKLFFHKWASCGELLSVSCDAIKLFHFKVFDLKSKFKYFPVFNLLLLVLSFQTHGSSFTS